MLRLWFWRKSGAALETPHTNIELSGGVDLPNQVTCWEDPTQRDALDVGVGVG